VSPPRLCRRCCWCAVWRSKSSSYLSPLTNLCPLVQ
jgi:hypothetical protein